MSATLFKCIQCLAADPLILRSTVVSGPIPYPPPPGWTPRVGWNPGFSTSKPGFTVKLTNVTYSDDVPTKKVKPHCWSCDVPLCEALDAYYGDDPKERDMCIQCRRS